MSSSDMTAAQIQIEKEQQQLRDMVKGQLLRVRAGKAVREIRVDELGRYGDMMLRMMEAAWLEGYRAGSMDAIPPAPDVVHPLTKLKPAGSHDWYWEQKLRGEITDGGHP